MLYERPPTLDSCYIDYSQLKTFFRLMVWTITNMGPHHTSSKRSCIFSMVKLLQPNNLNSKMQRSKKRWHVKFILKLAIWLH